MADGTHSKADEAARLEAALERIARLRPRARPDAVPPHSGGGSAEAAQRLDALIAELRVVLGRHAAD